MKYLLEIGVEELPPSMMSNIFSQLKEHTRSFIEKNEIICDDCTFGMTPRRLISYIEGIEAKTMEKTIDIKGPPKSICFDKDGKVTKPLEVFLKKNDIPLEKVVFSDDPKGSYATARIEISGKPVEMILGNLGPYLYEKFTFAKSMRWGNGEFQFVRPIRWVLSLLGNKKLDITIAGVKSSDHTFSSGAGRSRSIKIEGVQDYFTIMEKEAIILSPTKRVESVKAQLDAIAENIKATYDPDPELLEEISCLLEIPKAIKGSFDSKYLALPSEVLIQTMKKNQKFIVFKQNHKVINTFVGFYNGKLNEEAEVNVKRGYQRVLIARLADADYFYEKDMKVDFDQLYEKLDGVLYHHKLSTMKRKMENVRRIAEYLNDALNLKISVDRIAQAARYCKTDLLTEMVNEFAELQGIMGRIYVNRKYSLPEVSTAISEHYLPRFKNDVLPETSLGSLFAIADKIETIFGAVVASIKFSGSKDPYGIRRTANGLIEVILYRKLDFDLATLCGTLTDIFQDLIVSNSVVPGDVCSEFKSLLVQRAKQFFTDRGHKYDYVDSVISEESVNFHRWSLKLDALETVSTQVDICSVVIPAVRINNILKDYSSDQPVEPSLFETGQEAELFRYYTGKKPVILEQLGAREYVECIRTVTSFGPVLDSFFSEVHVNAENPAIRENRLRLLCCIQDLFSEVIDFSRIVKEG